MFSLSADLHVIVIVVKVLMFSVILTLYLFARLPECVIVTR